jgi:hypothetical protein
VWPWYALAELGSVRFVPLARLGLMRWPVPLVQRRDQNLRHRRNRYDLR